MMKKKNICMFLCRPFANDNRVTRSAEELAKNGNNVLVLAYHEEGLLENENIINFKVKRLKLTTKNIGNSKICKLIKYFEYVLRTFVFSILFKPDICHCNDIDTLIFGYLHYNLFRIPFIYDSHEYFQDYRYNNLPLWAFVIQSKLERMLSKKASAVITVSNYIAESLKRDFNRKNIHIIRNISNLSNNQDINKNTSDYVNQLIYLGQIGYGRATDNIIKALSLLKDYIRVYFFGYYNESDIMKYHKLARDYNVRNRIIFEKPLCSDKIISITSLGLAGLCIIQNISTSYYYSLPNKLFEYIQAGIPVIGSDSPEIRNIVDTYGIGVIVDPDSPESIAEGIKDIIYKGRKHFKDNNDKAKQIFNWENESKKLIEIYDSLYSIKVRM